MADVPNKALKVLEHIRRTGSKPEGYVGNRRHFNVGGRLPEGGDYREFDVDPRPEAGPRSSERLIIDRNTGRVWYTGDHYETFVEIDGERDCHGQDTD